MIIPDNVRALDRDLRALFGSRLLSLIAFESPHVDGAAASTIGVVDRLSASDLDACASHMAAWHDAGLRTPLLVASHELTRSLDAFPLEFGAILANHALVSGVNPFENARVEHEDLRRACEIQARSHLLHLREGYLETEGRGDKITDLLWRSAKPLAALIASVSRLNGSSQDTNAEGAARKLEAMIGAAPDSLAEIVRLSPAVSVGAERARAIFGKYLEAVERLTQGIDKT